MQSDRQERISERAYQIWVAEGRVHGKHDEHWRRAERAIAEEEMRLAAALANRAAGAAETGQARPRRARSETAPARRRGQRAPNAPSSC